MIRIDSIKSHIEKVRSGENSVEDFISAVIDKCKKINKKLNCFNTISEDFALNSARELDKKIKSGKKTGRLIGVPISVKDCICVKGVESTAGSKILKDYKPPFNATCVDRIIDEDGIIIGKTTQDEFGFGGFSTNVGINYNIPRNPFDQKRSTGGSSGGAAAITSALDMPHIAIGESTGGSISSPASYCGVAGLTPTYGRVSRWGLIDFANSMDKIGPIGKTVEDCALLLSVMSGKDKYDSTVTQQSQIDFTEFLINSMKGIKIGVPKEYFIEGVDEEISESVWSAIKKLEGLGASYEECSLPTTKYGVADYYLIAMCEASTNLAKFCGMRYGFHEDLTGNFEEYFSKVRGDALGPEAKRRIILGSFARMAGFRDAYYLKAMKIRTKIIQDFKLAFKKFDVLITPTMPILPPRFDELGKLEPIQIYMLDICTNPPNVAGIPHISVPCDFINGLPVGMQIMADHLQEKKIIQVAHTFERNIYSHKKVVIK